MPTSATSADSKDAVMADLDFPGGGTELLSMTRWERGPDHSRVVVLALAGELDQSNAGALWDPLARELGRRRGVVLDLCAVTFFASVGVRLLLRAHTRSRSSGATLAVVASPMVHRTLEVLGLLDHLPLHPTYRDALSHCAACLSNSAPLR